MRFAYADPPYPGCGGKYEEGVEVDHVLLIGELCERFPDGWAMSTASTTLRDLLANSPEDVRVGAWVKPFASFKPNVNPAYAWEPVLFRGGRKRERYAATVRDWVSANIMLKKGLTGAKPEQFNHWIIDLLGAEPGDEFVDVFPGTMSFTDAWERWQKQLKFADAMGDA